MPIKMLKNYRGKFPSWQPCSLLFPPLSEESKQAVEILPQTLLKARPLKKAHAQSLPEDINALSNILTQNRADLRTSYWMHPANLSAYLYYFLPWNIIRLIKLFSSLPLPTPESINDRMPLLIDFGSGPLTLPIALWIAKPEWREFPLRILAVDTAKQPLAIGIKLFETLGVILKQPLWKVTPVVSSASSLKIKNRVENYPWLISAANLLNELDLYKKHSKNSLANNECGRMEIAFDGLLKNWIGLFGTEELLHLLFVEPGTRLGGSSIMKMRKCAIDSGFAALSPCTHDNDCPLLQSSKSWCHFTFPVTDAPEWLIKLSENANLPKQSLTMSPLLLTNDLSHKKNESLTGRVVSQPFKVPGIIGESRYVCYKDGLGLLANSKSEVSGSLVKLHKGKQMEYDQKSGALIFSAD